VEEIRDYALIVGFISLAVLTLIVLIAVSAIGYLSLRVVDALNRFAEGRMAGVVTGANTRLSRANESGPTSVLDLALFGFTLVQRVLAERKPKPKPRQHFGFPFFSR